MAFTRAQANELLNKSEMLLYDGSRANALRGLDRAALAARIARARAARDRARDLLKRQRQAARARGEGKSEGIAARTARKEALLVEILQRFVDARREAPAAAASKVPARKAAAKKAAKAVDGTASASKTARKPAAARSATGKTATRKATTPRAAAGNAATVKTGAAKKAGAGTSSTAARASRGTTRAAKNAAATGAGTSQTSAGAVSRPKRAPARKAARRVSPERALENTRRLLEAKHERDRTPQPWQALDPAGDHAPQPGYQSPQAASQARELHAGESRMASIHGSNSTRDRYNQGKRDHRGDTD